MDFVTLTDHETIEGALALAHRPDFFVGEEVSAYLPEEDGYVDVLVYGLDEEAHGEAQASGLPAVVSGIGGPRERIRPGVSGFVADPDEFFSRVELLLDDAATRTTMGRAARESAEGMGREAVLDAMIELHARLAGSRPEPGVYARS